MGRLRSLTFVLLLIFFVFLGDKVLAQEVVKVAAGLPRLRMS